MTEPLQCSAPVPGGCPKTARDIILAMPSIDRAGPLAVWAVHPRCGDEHSADTDASAILRADPGATVLVFRAEDAFEKGSVYWSTKDIPGRVTP